MADLIERDQLFIGGEWVAPSGSDRINVIEPATEEPVGSVPDGTPADIDKAVAAARHTFDETEWSRSDPAERAEILERLSKGIDSRGGDLGPLVTRENGAPIIEATFSQIGAPTRAAAWFAELAREYQFAEIREPAMGPPMHVWHEPVGVVAAITPWNVPLFSLMTKIGAALAAGCTVVAKPAPETPLCTMVFAELLEEAGVPKGVVSIVPGGREVGEYLVSHPGINKIAFTGSTAAGRRIASICGEQMKRASMELGGKSAAIICDDANLETVLPLLMRATMPNAGQTCYAQTRILAPRARYDEVAEAMTEAVRALKVGNPLDPTVQVGPVVAERQRDRVEGYIKIGQDEGAKISVGGGRPAELDRGWFVEPTVFVNVDNSMRIAQEEIFGPVLCVIPYDDDADAIRIANDSEFGLAGTVWTADTERGIGIARRVRSGTYGVNFYMPDAKAPWGGFKASGFGRELGREGLEEYLETKALRIA